ncbi:UNVERIFIED_CONTAM: hypothetical protein RMT77_016252 [Armadillidium vulgare]
MSSSSIEVMSGNDMEMVLMDSPEKNNKEDIHTLAAADPLPSYIMQSQDTEEQPEETEDLENMTPIDPLDPSPGSIIFSPQDMMATSRFKVGRTRGRGRAKGIRRSDALTIKIEEGVDYSKIIVPVACEICGKMVANGKNLVQHMTTHSDIKPYQCPHCLKSFARMVHLQGHLVLHGIEKQFECPVCHQRFSRQDCVKVHMRLHDKSKCVFCEVCHKAFLTLGALNIHMRIHRGEKPFKCHLCGKCFTQKNHVITHIKRHTKVSNTPYSKKLGPRMFQCEHCPRSFIRLSDYERHVQWNHGAVADASSLSEKLPMIDSFSEMDKVSLDSSFSSFLPLAGTTLNNKVKKKSIRKVMCTIGTQTDQEGGHVIIPRQYQSASSMIETSTQVSAPPTPRPNDDDMYENDIFDEGMDRNFSSDEEYDDQNSNQEVVSYQESETTTYFQDGGTDSAKDDAFDAVLGKPKPEPSKVEETNSEQPGVSESSIEADSNENDHEIQSELGSEYSKREVIETQLGTNTFEEKKVETANNIMDDEPTSKMIPVESSKPAATTEEKSISKPLEQFKKPSSNVSHKFAVPSLPKAPRIVENFNTKNWKGRLGAPRGRGRGRGKNKNIMGLTGATHLRLIRKSMINFITEKTEQMNCPDKNENSSEEQFENAESSDKRTKRQAKCKPHAKDFVCNVKTCETCNPFVPNSYSSQEIVANNDDNDTPTNSSETTSKDQSQKLLQFLLSGDESNLQGTDFRLISDVKEIQLESKRFKMDDVSSFKTQEEFENSKIFKGVGANEKHEKTDYFIPVSKSGDYVSPPVELQAFCIPTYSCKLCGREFRFEGKLHRHIESVHQHKPIFSPDVKPGRGATREIDRELLQTLLNSQVEKPLKQPPVKKVVPRNPEIEALRSEWDDDDDDNDDDDDQIQNPSEEANTLHEDIKIQGGMEQSSPTTFSALLNRTQQYSRPIITREIVAVRDTVTDSYASGVKVNINKISGLAGSDFEFAKQRYEIPTSSVSEVIPDKKEKLVHTLDMKCRKLLEKLFDHSLLIECGLFQEHVSVVLGRILQHYGVKMIEDYGQGQYEVLKYNLWRLIEWKVTMEQMEEFYTDGKSVEEMMDDIMNGRVPIIAHHEPQVESHQQQQQQPESSQSQNNVNQIQTMEAVQISDNQLMLSQVANVLSGQLNLGEGVTQVVLAQDVSPEMLQGAHIVTIDPTTGQVLSQVTADQVILTDSLPEEMGQIQTIDSSQVTSHTSSIVSNLPPGSIVAATPVAAQQAGVTTSVSSEQIINTGGTLIKIETSTHSS